MASSGITVDPGVIDRYGELKKSKNIAFIVCCTENQTKVVEKSYKLKSAYEGPDITSQVKADIIDICKPDDCLYMIIDDATARKVAIFLWAPDTANVKKKMIASSTLDALKKKLDGIGDKPFQCNDMDDLQDSLDTHFGTTKK